jgi:hypothetical protein
MLERSLPAPVLNPRELFQMKTSRLFGFVAVVALLFVAVSVEAGVKLPSVIGDNKVLQREQAVPVWGWDAPGTARTVRHAGPMPTRRTCPPRPVAEARQIPRRRAGSQGTRIYALKIVDSQRITDSLRAAPTCRMGADRRRRRGTNQLQDQPGGVPNPSENQEGDDENQIPDPT